MTTKRVVEIAIWLTLLFSASSACAATWSEHVTVPVSLQYETNPNLEATGSHHVWRLNGSPGINILAVQDLNQWNANFTLRVERSTDKVVLPDREDPAATVGWKHEFERGEFGITASYEQSSSRSSVLKDTGLVVPKDGNQTNKSIAVHWLRALSEVMSLSVGGDVAKYSYSGVSLPGNTTRSLNAKLNYSWSEQLMPYVYVDYSRFEPDLGDHTIHMKGMLGFDWFANEYLSYGLEWGLNNTSTGGSGATDWQGAARMQYAGERFSANLGASRTTESSGAASSISSDQVTGRWSYVLTDFDSAGLDFSWRKNLGTSSAENHDLNVWYGRELNAFWVLRLNCGYRQNKTELTSADDKVIGATITYATPNF